MSIRRVIDDVLTLINANFVFGTVNTLAGGTDALTAKPPIVLDHDYVDAKQTMTDSCIIVLVDEQEAVPEQIGEFRYEIYFVTGYIYYESRTDKNSAMIKAIKSHIRSICNVNNVSSTRTYTITPHTAGYNENPKIGEVPFTLRVKTRLVSAVS